MVPLSALLLSEQVTDRPLSLRNVRCAVNNEQRLVTSLRIEIKEKSLEPQARMSAQLSDTKRRIKNTKRSCDGQRAGT